jgi:hypothetical protein
METMKVSIDFDGTLSHTVVEKFAERLLKLGVDVWICTLRFDDTHKDSSLYHNNDEIFAVAERLGIPRNKVVFTNYQDKDTFFKDHPDFVWHLDDDFLQLMAISKTRVKGVNVLKEGWKSRCIDLLNL